MDGRSQSWFLRLKLSQETLTRDATHDAQRRRKTVSCDHWLAESGMDSKHECDTFQDSQSETSMLSAMQRVKWLTSKKSEVFAVSG